MITLQEVAWLETRDYLLVSIAFFIAAIILFGLYIIYRPYWASSVLTGILGGFLFCIALFIGFIMRAGAIKRFVK